jgi:putative ABC transport system permease protein
MAPRSRGPRLARALLARLAVYQESHSLLEDLDETYSELRRTEGGGRADLWYWKSAIVTFAAYLWFIASWRIQMLKNHLIVVYRNFLRHKLFSFINVFGLGVGLAVCLMISLWVIRELSYDRFHGNAGRIYRVERELFRDNLYSRWPITGGAYRQALTDEVPGVESAVRFWRRRLVIKDHDNIRHQQGLYATDNSVFEIFDFPLEEGDERTALTEPMTVVMTAEDAVRYFGSAKAVGRSLPVEWSGKIVDFKVTGILKKVPRNSHIRFDMLISLASYPKEQFDGWRANYLYTYVLLGKGVSVRDTEERLKTFVERRLAPYYGDLLAPGRGIHDVLKMVLFPLTGIHLRPSVNWEAEPGGSILSVTAFSLAAALILIIACLNFVNLSTARASRRAKEVGLRKTLGARQGQLRWLFLNESLMFTFIALGSAFAFSELFIRAYNRIFSGDLALAPLLEPRSLIVIGAAAFAVGILAGLYPAFYLTRFEPAGTLKGGAYQGRRKSRFRRNLVVIQFGVSIVIIIGMLTVSRQMSYIRARSLGFDRSGLVLLQVLSSQGARSYGSFRSEMLRDPRILAVSSANDAPGDPQYGNGAVMLPGSNEVINMIFYTVGYDQTETYGMDMAAGRTFSRDFGADAAGAVMLNESGARRMGWTPGEAVGKRLVLGGSNNAPAPVVGVVRNFNFKSLRSEVEPAVIVLNPGAVGQIAVRIKPGEEEGALRAIRESWQRAFPEELFAYRFLDDRLEGMYEGEKSLRNFFAVFSGLSVLLSCLGLFGLVSFTAEEKTREIGIRKALGATTGSVVLLLSKGFIKWILLANVLAWPVAWVLMNKWLENFAYKAGIGWQVFLVTALLTTAFGVITFIIQTLKAASAVPSENLRHE